MSDKPSLPQQAVEKAEDFLEHNVQGAFRPAAEKAAKKIEEATSDGFLHKVTGGIKEDTAKKWLPWVAGGAAAAVGLLLLEPINWVSKKLFQGAKQIVTGFGYFEELPLVGGLFKGLGNLVEKMGDYAGYIVPAVAAFIGYKMLSEKGIRASQETRGGRDGTGTVGNPPYYTGAEVVNPRTQETLAKEDVPSQQGDTAPPLSATARQTLDNAGIVPETRSPSQLSEARLAAIRQNNEALDKALGEYMLNYNKDYETSRNWAAAAQKFANEGPRANLMGALQRIGFTAEEADKMVPKPPDLQATIYKDGTDFPPELVNFAKKFEATYGNALGDIRLEGSDRRLFDTSLKWDTMSVTQREEFLEKAIRFTDERFKFFEARKESFSPPTDGAYVAIEGYNYREEWPKGTSLWTRIFSLPPEGSSYGMTWKDEHAFIKDAYDIKEEMNYGLGYMTSRQKVGNKYQEMFDQWKAQQVDSDAHKKVMHDAKGQIRAFGQQVEIMKQKLQDVKTGKLVPSQAFSGLNLDGVAPGQFESQDVQEHGPAPATVARPPAAQPTVTIGPDGKPIPRTTGTGAALD